MFDNNKKHDLIHSVMHIRDQYVILVRPKHKDRTWRAGLKRWCDEHDLLYVDAHPFQIYCNDDQMVVLFNLTWG